MLVKRQAEQLAIDRTSALAEFRRNLGSGAKKVENQSPAFERLHALARKGYRPKIGKDASDGTIALHHLGRTHDLVLHPDGTVEELGGRVPRHKRKLEILAPIPASRDSDHLRFMKFLEAVPRATLRDRTRPWRTEYLDVPAALMTVWGLSLLFTAFITDM